MARFIVKRLRKETFEIMQLGGVPSPSINGSFSEYRQATVTRETVEEVFESFTFEYLNELFGDSMTTK